MEIIGVTESVLQYLRVYIITGDLAPGQKLNEVELSSRLNVSRPPIREAFRILENESLVTSFPRKGCFVSQISIKDCRNVFEVRTMIECFAIDLFQAKGIRELSHAVTALEVTKNAVLPPADDGYGRYKYLRDIAEFHIQLVAHADNLRLVEIFDGIFPSLARYQSLYTYIPGLMDKSHKEHEEILHLIEKENYDEAKKDLEFHIHSFIPLIEETIDDWERNGEVEVKGVVV